MRYVLFLVAFCCSAAALAEDAAPPPSRFTPPAPPPPVTLQISPQEAQQLAQMLELYSHACMVWQPLQACTMVTAAWETRLQAAVEASKAPAKP
jgi:hypothetical protein